MLPNEMPGLSQGQGYLKDQMIPGIKEYKPGKPCLSSSRWCRLTLLKTLGERDPNTWCVRECVRACVRACYIPQGKSSEDKRVGSTLAGT